ncbi:MAG TPA: hypothetical protein VGU22_11090 [Methylomirabilota bacterium]|jgi:hypothetical protein|nr:hypothetical protein [Methylomirabilota bacterium]
MSYGFRPENWPAFQEELDRRQLTIADIEKLELTATTVTLTLRSGRVESWRQRPLEPFRARVE